MHWFSSILFFTGIYFAGGNLGWSCFITFALYILFGGHDKGMKFAFTVKRDFNAARMLIRQKIMYAYYTRMGMNIPKLWEKTVSIQPRKVALIEADSGKKYTFDEVNQVDTLTLSTVYA